MGGCARTERCATLAGMPLARVAGKSPWNIWRMMNLRDKRYCLVAHSQHPNYDRRRDRRIRSDDRDPCQRLKNFSDEKFSTVEVTLPFCVSVFSKVELCFRLCSIGGFDRKAEAFELRDGDPKRYRGLGCRRAAANIADELNRELSGTSSGTKLTWTTRWWLSMERRRNHVWEPTPS